MSARQATIVVQTQAVAILLDLTCVHATLVIVEMVLIAQVCLALSYIMKIQTNCE